MPDKASSVTRHGHRYWQTIEGNSADQVRRRVYLASSSVINGFGRLC